MSMPIEWEYLEKDANFVSNVGKQLANTGKGLLSNKTTTGIVGTGTAFAGQMAGDMAIDKAKSHLSGGYQ